MNRTPSAQSRIARSASRERVRARNAGKREPLADRVPKPIKRTAGRAAAPLTPANIRVDGVRLDEDDRAYIRRRLGEKLGKYASSIERVTVRVRDINGPRGGIDLLCRIKVVMSGLPSVVVDHQSALLKPAITRALTGVERAVRQTVQRRRMRPIRSAARRVGRLANPNRIVVGQHQGAAMRVADLMQKDVRTIAPEATVADLVQAMADSRVSGLPVVTPTGHVIGVVSATDVLQAGAEHTDATSRENLFEQQMVRDLMTPNPYVIQPDADVREAAQHMLYTDVRRLFVEDQGRLVGVISQTDIAHAVGTGRI